MPPSFWDSSSLSSTRERSLRSLAAAGPASNSSVFVISVAPHHRYHLAQDLGLEVFDGLILVVGRHEPHLAIPAAQGVFTVASSSKRSHHDLATAGPHSSSGPPPGHRGECLPPAWTRPHTRRGRWLSEGETLGIQKVKVVLNALSPARMMGEPRRPVCPTTGIWLAWGSVSSATGRGGHAEQGDGQVCPSALTVTPASSSPLRWEVDRGGGLEAHGGADSPAPRGIAVLCREIQDIIVNFFAVSGSGVFHSQAPSGHTGRRGFILQILYHIPLWKSNGCSK